MAVAAFMAAFVALLGALQLFQRRFSPHPELPRKLLHAGSGLLTLSFPFLFDRLWPVLLLTGRQRTLDSGREVPQALAKTARGVSSTASLARHWEKSTFRSRLRSSSGCRLAASPLLFCIPILVLTLADATGALVGLRYGQTRFEGASKSVEGSFAFLIVAFFCIHIPLLLWGTSRARRNAPDLAHHGAAGDAARGKRVARSRQPVHSDRRVLSAAGLPAA